MNGPEKINSKTETNEKEQRWEEMQKHVEGIRGREHNPVGEPVKQAVTGLNLFGVRTIFSGEGRMEDFRRATAPFIDIESPESPILSKEYEERNKDNGYSSFPEGHSSAEETQKLIAQKNLEERTKLIPLLDEFYKERRSSYDAMLTIESLKDNVNHVTNQGARLQELNDDDTRKKNLERYQDEMRAFGEFLKKKYFEE